jgi:hypothetical protein
MEVRAAISKHSAANDIISELIGVLQKSVLDGWTVAPIAYQLYDLDQKWKA